MTDHTTILIPGRAALGEDDPTCPSGLLRPDPLIVDWPAEQRVDLAVGMETGLVVLRASCSRVHVLRGCSAKAAYPFASGQITRTALHFEGSDQIRANLPFDGAHLDVTRSTAVDVALAYVGRRTTERTSIARNELVGDCAGARYFVRTAWVGAFRVASGAVGRAQTFDEVYASHASKGLLHHDGVLARCEAHSSVLGKAPDQCEAPIRIELGMVVEPPTSPPTPTPRTAEAKPLAQVSPQKLLSPDRMIVRAVADDDGIYFFEGRKWPGFRLMHLPRPSSRLPLNELEAMDAYGDLRTDATTIYWINQKGIHSLAKSGANSIRTIASVQAGGSGSAEVSTSGLVVDDTHVFWASYSTYSNGTLRRVPKVGGKVETLATGLRWPEVVAIDEGGGDDGEVYYQETTKPGLGEATPSTQEIRALSKKRKTGTGTGNSGMPRLVQPNIRSLRAVVADKEHLYWIADTGGWSDGALYRAPKRGAPKARAELLVASVPTFYQHPLSIDAKFVYWLEYPSSLSGPMNVRAFAKSGNGSGSSLPITLATSPTANKIFVDSESVYWADDGVFAVPRPW